MTSYPFRHTFQHDNRFKHCRRLSSTQWNLYGLLRKGTNVLLNIQLLNGRVICWNLDIVATKRAGFPCIGFQAIFFNEDENLFFSSRLLWAKSFRVVKCHVNVTKWSPCSQQVRLTVMPLNLDKLIGYIQFRDKSANIYKFNRVTNVYTAEV